MKFFLAIFACFALSCRSPQNNKFGKEKIFKDSEIISQKNLSDSLKRPFQVVFKEIKEIHKNSPYYTCKIEIVGTNKIQLPQTSWQDKLAWTEDSKKLVLVKWDNLIEFLVFTFFIIDTETGAHQESIKMAGAINSLQIRDDIITYNKFLHNKAISKDTLCCIVEENY